MSDQGQSTFSAAMRRLRMYSLAYVSALPMIAGWAVGLVLHRVHDGWKVARLQLDRIDDAVIDDMEASKSRRTD